MTIQQQLLTLFNAKTISSAETLQSLWSGYGSIDRYSLRLHNGQTSSVVVKAIQAPTQSHHPRGWNTSRSHQRKLQSYQVEQAWYQHWAQHCDEDCKIASHFATFELPAEAINTPPTTAIVLEDLDALGFNKRATNLSIEQSKVCLKWLAYFHGSFMVDTHSEAHQQAASDWPKGLWPTGCYWHLQTRPDEFEAMADSDLKAHAHDIDHRLNHCRFKTIVHGDAKVANFCFKANGNQVAAVDFQYVGGGCGMKDVAYFLGSCLSEQDCAEHYPALLKYYFNHLQSAIQSKHPNLDTTAIETEWRRLFTLAWADFHRFILGWSPQHFKNNSFSALMSRKAIADL